MRPPTRPDLIDLAEKRRGECDALRAGIVDAVRLMESGQTQLAARRLRTLTRCPPADPEMPLLPEKGSL
jgi:hypothetical protein